MAKMVKLVNKDKTMCNELHKELNMQGFPAKKVPLNMFLIADTDDLFKEVMALKNEVARMSKIEAKRRWMSGARTRKWR